LKINIQSDWQPSVKTASKLPYRVGIMRTFLGFKNRNRKQSYGLRHLALINCQPATHSARCLAVYLECFAILQSVGQPVTGHHKGVSHALSKN